MFPFTVDFNIIQNSVRPLLLVTWTDGQTPAQPVAWTAGTTATFRMNHMDDYGNILTNVVNDAAAIAQNNGSGLLELGFDFSTIVNSTATAGYFACTWRPNIGGASPRQEWPVRFGRKFIVLIEAALP